MTFAYEHATGCTDKSSYPAALAMVAQWKQTTGLGNKGIYNCRPIRGGTSYSIHSEARASDLTADALDPTQKRLMDGYTQWLLDHHDELRVQQMIWNRRIWRVGVGWRTYTGTAGPHLDHAHIELTRGAPVSALYSTDPFGSIPTGGEDMEALEILSRVDDNVTQVLQAVQNGIPGQPGHETAVAEAVRCRQMLTGEGKDSEGIPLQILRAVQIGKPGEPGFHQTIHDVIITQELVRSIDSTGTVDVDLLAERLAGQVPDAIVAELLERLAA